MENKNFTIFNKIEQFNIFHSVFLELINTKQFDFFYNKKGTISNIQHSFHFNKNLVVYNTLDYVLICNFIQTHLIEVFSAFFKRYHSIKHTVCFSTDTELHEFSPRFPFLALNYKIVDKNNLTIVKIKFSPYISNETNKRELKLDFKLLDPQYIMFMQTFLRILKQINLTVNFSNNGIYFYAILNKLVCSGLNQNKLGYETDLIRLHDYANKINNLVNLDLNFNDVGIIQRRNKNVKLMSLQDLVPFPTLTSYVIDYSN